MTDHKHYIQISGNLPNRVSPKGERFARVQLNKELKAYRSMIIARSQNPRSVSIVINTSYDNPQTKKEALKALEVIRDKILPHIGFYDIRTKNIPAKTHSQEIKDLSTLTKEEFRKI